MCSCNLWLFVRVEPLAVRGVAREQAVLEADAEGGLVVAKDGQQVEVCGPGARRVLPELGRIAGQHGYRREPKVLCSDGKPIALVLLRPLED